MTETIKLLQSHTSVRSFDTKKLSEQMLTDIINAASTTSSWSMLQVVSIIRIDDPELRAKISLLSGNQTSINEAAEFWIFCSDFHRNHTIAPEVDLGYVQYPIIGAFDAGLMAQNTLTAVESLGLGGVMIGGVRVNIKEISELLKLPKHVFPLAGLAFGYIKGEKREIKKKLPKELLIHTNEYKEMDSYILKQYDQAVKQAYETSPMPSLNRTPKTWSEHIQSTLEPTNSMMQYDFMQFLNEQGLNKK